MIIKIHEIKDGSGRKIIALCDSNLLGKRFEERGLQLDLTTNFYKGKEANEEEICEAIKKDCYVVNLVGKEAVKLGIKTGIINKDKVIKIKKVPHAQAML